MKKKITIIDNSNGKKFDFSVIKGSHGPAVVDFITIFTKKLECLYTIQDLNQLLIFSYHIYRWLIKKVNFYIEAIVLKI